MEKPEQNRRNDVRRRVLKSARIVFKNHRVTIDCVVRNLSDRGACLKVENAIGIPDSFELMLTPASVRNCRVAWRKPTMIGVEFSKLLEPASHRSIAR
jgi:PilZ domain